MRPYLGQKIGQSPYELTLAVFFSFFLHAALIILALFIYTATGSKIYVPPFYDVKLVRLPTEPSPTPQQEAPPVQKAEPAKEKAKKVLPKVTKAAPKKGAMPEYAREKPKAAQPEEEKPEAASTPQAKPAGKAEGVVVSAASGEDFKFPPYLTIIREIIGQNWNPPPGVKGLQVKVAFKVLRSGRVFGDVNIEQSSGNNYFDMAARRAILSSSPFPPMPDEFYKQSAEFSVDLMEKE